MRAILFISIALFFLLMGASYEKEHHLRQAVNPLLIIKGVCYAYQAICALFGVRKTTTYKDINTKKGFKKYVGSTLHDYMEGFEPEYFDELVDAYAEMLSMTKEAKEALQGVIEDIQVCESQAWMEYNLIFDQESLKRGKMSFLSIFSKEEDDGTYTLLFVYMNSSFQLSDNLRLVSERTQVGVFSDTTKQHIEAKPRGMTNEDVDSLFWFFKLATYRYVADKLGGVKLPDPKLKDE